MISSLRIKVSAGALAQIEEAAAWWAQNRPSAPDAIRQDLAETLAILVAQPGIRAPARRSRVRGIRRASLRIRGSGGVRKLRWAAAGRRAPSGAARTLLLIAHKNPKALLEVA